ncbi:MAG: hypothetical protein R3265_07950, partial [Hyphomonas sp.]|nr:hypothetical protein [Hyphomonas sp.]
IYPSGESVKFSVGVLYGSDSWQFDSERLIQRQHMGRAVRIETAMNRPLLKILADKNDYLLCLGLSSTRDGDSSDQRDEKLAVARAYNLGHAATRLKWKTEDRVFGLTLGKAKTAPSMPELEPLQRSAVIVGVNASRDVVARDVVISAASIISLNGVDLSQYSRPLANPSTIRDIKFEGGYLEASKVQFRRETSAPAPLLILKAIPKQ